VPKEKIKRLYRSGENKVLGGVCGGLGEYFNVDPVIIRILWVAFSLLYGVGILAYILAWIIVPMNPDHKR
jgi:phage shock protein C